jgi:adenosylhomocysteine nucleosidase
MTRVAMVAALEREVRLLVRNWRVVEREYESVRLKFFESGDGAVVVCGGIGAEPARRAVEAVITLYQPMALQSVGFAGALDRGLRVGEIFSPSIVIDAKDGSRINLDSGRGALLSFSSIASVEQKSKLAAAYAAEAIDMEAAAVAKSADAHGVEFRATKVISDEFDFEMPPMDRFVSCHGSFLTGGFLTFTALRPWLWSRVIRLGRNSNIAARALCSELARQLGSQAEKATKLHSTIRV